MTELGKPTQSVSFLLSQEIATEKVLRHFIDFCGLDIETLLGPGELFVEEISSGRWLAKIPEEVTPAIELGKNYGVYELRLYGWQLPREKTMLQFLEYCRQMYEDKS